jgi:VIT1/CCC1 family predicted Fe2+/Mn2+ transporter
MSIPHDESLEIEHTPGAVRARLLSTSQHSYLGDFVLGAVDGTVTTFAVVSGVAGAGLEQKIALILGLANLVADGFSMAVGNYLSTKADRELVDRARRSEQQHIERVPAGEREEIRQIFAAKGFEGPLLEEIVSVITQDQKRWINTMLTEEFGLRLESPSPVKAAAATFTAFVLAGFVPLFPLLLPGKLPAATIFGASAMSTALAFFLIGAVKGHIVKRSWLLSGLETLGIGSAAAALAYAVGMLFSLR